MEKCALKVAYKKVLYVNQLMLQASQLMLYAIFTLMQISLGKMTNL